MITIIIIATIASIAMASYESIIPVLVEAWMNKRDMEAQAAMSLAEDACHCLACNRRKERAMSLMAINNPDEFLANIARDNGSDSTAMIWAETMVKEIQEHI